MRPIVIKPSFDTSFVVNFVDKAWDKACDKDVLLKVGCLCVLLLAAGCSREASDANTAQARRGALVVTHTYEATIDARRTEAVTVKYAGGAILTEVAPEGQRVAPGDVLARFDDDQARRDYLRLQRDAELARLEKETLESATLPLELDDLDLRIAQARADLEAEEGLLANVEALQRDKYMSAREVEQQRGKVARMAGAVATMERERELLEQYSHPARLARANATLLAAVQELSLASQQVDHCVIRAPSAGLVTHVPLHIVTEYRTVRVGDTLNKNQHFMSLPDIGDWVGSFYVPEVELGQVSSGAPVQVIPLAYPNLVLTGSVEFVSAMAQEVPGQGSWLKQFRVVASLNVPAAYQELLRPGMSARLIVTSYQQDNALLVPRAAMAISGTNATVRVARWRGVETRAVTAGRMSRAEVEILSGLKEGDEVVLE